MFNIQSTSIRNWLRGNERLSFPRLWLSKIHVCEKAGPLFKHLWYYIVLLTYIQYIKIFIYLFERLTGYY